MSLLVIQPSARPTATATTADSTSSPPAPGHENVPVTAARDRHVVEHDRRDVVEKPFALEDRDQPARQSGRPVAGMAATGSGGGPARRSAEGGRDRQPGTISLATTATAAIVTKTRATASSRIGRTLAVNWRQEVRCTSRTAAAAAPAAE